MKAISTGYMNNTLMSLLVIILLILSGCTTTSMRQHPEFSKNHNQYKVITVLPPDVEIELIKFTGENERLYDEEESLAKEIISEIIVELELHGYTPSHLNFNKLSEENTNKIRAEIEKIKTAYSEVSKELYVSHNINEAKALQMQKTIGPMVNYLSDMSGSDALLITALSGFKKSGGQRTKEIIGATLLALATGFVPVSPGEGAGLEFAMIDGTTGDVLWTNVKAGLLDPKFMVRTTINGLQAHNDSPVANATVHEIRSKRDSQEQEYSDDSYDPDNVINF